MLDLFSSDCISQKQPATDWGWKLTFFSWTLARILAVVFETPASFLGMDTKQA